MISRMSHLNNVKMSEQPRVKKKQNKTKNKQPRKSEPLLLWKFYIQMMVIDSC